MDDSSGSLLPPLGSHDQEPNVEIDTTRPHPARIYDFLLGGKDHYQADLDAGKKILAVSPAARAEALANRDFLHRAVAYAAGQGISQFLDIGTGIPTMGPTHQTAQRVNPQSRVVYVDNDPIVFTHSRTLLSTDHQTFALQADAREPETILHNPEVRRLLDFQQPIALMFVGLLYFIDDDADPWGLVAHYRNALSAGSHLLLSHVIETAQSRAATKAYESATSRLSPRSPQQIEALFDGWTLLEPGVVPIHEWRPTGGETTSHQIVGGIGRLA